MKKYTARNLTLALTLAVLTASAAKATAQSTTAAPPPTATGSTPPPASPSIVTGTDPAPDVIEFILTLLHLA